jgi:hypothetical protein
VKVLHEVCAASHDIFDINTGAPIHMHMRITGCHVQMQENAMAAAATRKNALQNPPRLLSYAHSLHEKAQRTRPGRGLLSA